MKRFPRLNLKNINRLFMLAVVFAPIFYLFGSLFSGLNGARGTQLWADPVYVQEYVSVDSITDDDDTYRLRDIGSLEPLMDSNLSRLDFSSGDLSFNGNSVSYVNKFLYQNFWYYSIGVFGSSTLYIAQLNTSTNAYTESSRPWVFVGKGFAIEELASIYSSFSISFSLEKLVSVPTDYVPENNSAYTDFIFGQFFAKDNFLVQMGKDSLSADPNGFAPANSLVQLLDGSVFHFGSENQIACMAYGYAVWVFNAVVLDMVIVLSLKLLLLPLRAVEIFEKGEKE